MWNDDWASAAMCKQASPDELFVRGAEQHRAKLVCSGCPVRTECLAEGAGQRDRVGRLGWDDRA